MRLFICDLRASQDPRPASAAFDVRTLTDMVLHVVIAAEAKAMALQATSNASVEVMSCILRKVRGLWLGRQM